VEQPPAVEAEQPRRRSTVREPAPVSSESVPVIMPAPTPTPVVISTAAADEAAKPRRTGWWAKRLLGGGKD
jgi:ribonuclease E